MNEPTLITPTLITGATGLVGQRVAQRVERPLVVSRNAASIQADPEFSQATCLEWDSTEGPIDLSDHGDVRQVVNLMGYPIATKRWNPQVKKLIRDSRVKGTQNLIAGLRHSKLPETLVSASAIGIYGDRGNDLLTEESSPGDGFLAELCQDWEREALALEDEGVRVVILRIGLVISAQGGALSELLPIFKWGVGGKLGSGKQWMSWIHLNDLVELILWALSNHQARGIYNAVAPQPLQNVEFTRLLGKALRRPTFLPVPAFGLKLVKGEFAESLLESQRVIPERASEAGFHFEFEDCANAINHEINGQQ